MHNCIFNYCIHYFALSLPFCRPILRRTPALFLAHIRLLFIILCDASFPKVSCKEKPFGEFMTQTLTVPIKTIAASLPLPQCNTIAYAIWSFLWHRIVWLNSLDDYWSGCACSLVGWSGRKCLEKQFILRRTLGFLKIWCSREVRIFREKKPNILDVYISQRSAFMWIWRFRGTH